MLWRNSNSGESGKRVERETRNPGVWRRFIAALQRSLPVRSKAGAATKRSGGHLAPGATATGQPGQAMNPAAFGRSRAWFQPLEVSRYRGWLAEDYEALNGRLRALSSLPRPVFDRAWKNLPNYPAYWIVGQADYCQHHRERFFELANIVAELASQFERPRMLEVGVSAFSNLYSELFPELHLEVLERPVSADYPGYTAERCRQIAACKNVHMLDLNAPDARQVLESGAIKGFQLILCTEVLSVLQANPEEVLAGLLHGLAPGGFLVISSRNFLAAEARQALREGFNPAPYYPPGSGNWDRHHEYRDFTAVELFELAGQTGAQVAAFHFSACLDNPEQLQHMPEDQWRTLVMVLQRPAGTLPSVADEDREVVLHIGSDKAGSTAIQTHLYANRSWLRSRGVHVPEVFFNREHGHADLFRMDQLDLLIHDIRTRGRYQPKVLLSYEGAHFLEQEKLEKLAAALAPWQVRIIFYLREQAEIIQSGELQRIKSREIHTLRLLAGQAPLHETRDYYATLKRWEKIFPGLVCEPVFFAREDFPRGNVVADLLQRLGCEADQGFVFHDTDINTSLDVPSALAVERFAAEQSPDERELKSFIDTLLVRIRTHGQGQRHFYNPGEVATMRDFYRPNNRRLVEEYGVSRKLLDQPPQVTAEQGLDDPELTSRVEEILDWFRQLQDYPLCFDGAQVRQYLAQYLGPGWSGYEKHGHWSLGNSSLVKFRLPLRATLPGWRWLEIHLHGGYADDIPCCSRIQLNGADLGEFNLEEEPVIFPLAQLPGDMHLDLLLVHPVKKDTPVFFAERLLIHYR